jgi:hypothetical protein
MGLVASVPSSATAQTALTPADQAAIRQASDRGAMIYAYDQAAWQGTDDMLAKIPHPEQAVGGWIVDGPAAAPELVFFDKDQAHPHAVYVADFKDNRLVSSRVLGASDNTSLSADRVRLIHARAIAIAALEAGKVPRCSGSPYNTVVLPPAAPGEPVLVYILTPQTNNATIPFGGHYLIPVSAEGKAGEIRHFAKSCAVFPMTQKGKGTPEAAFITHLLDPTPTEIHVFSSLTLHLPVYVGTTDKRVWEVAGDRISLVDPKP